MNEIETTCLGDLLSSPPEYGANAFALPSNGINPRYLRITDIDDAGRLLHDDVKSIPLKVAEPYIMEQNDIVIARTGNTVGKSYIHDERNGRLAFAGYLVRFRIDDKKGDPKFVFQYLHSPQYWVWMANTIRTGAQPNVNASEYKHLPIPAFSLPEQRKIARILTTLDNLIEKTEALIAKYQAMKLGMMHDLFTRGVDAHGHLRPPYAEAPELYKESKLGWIPKEWAPKTLNEIVSPNRPIVYGILMPGYGHPGGIPVIKVKDIKNGVVDIENLLLTSPEIDRQYRRSKTNTGDLLFTIRGTVGRTAFVPQLLDGANITQDTARIGITEGDARFIRGYLEMPVPASFITTRTLGVAVQGINLGDVRKIPLAYPPPCEQNYVGDILDLQDQRLRDERQFLMKLQILKSGLMQDLLTGNVRVKID